MSNENRKYMNKLEQIAVKPFSVNLKGREVGKFVKDDLFGKRGTSGFDVT